MVGSLFSLHMLVSLNCGYPARLTVDALPFVSRTASFPNNAVRVARRNVQSVLSLFQRVKAAQFLSRLGGALVSKMSCQALGLVRWGRAWRYLRRILGKDLPTRKLVAADSRSRANILSRSRCR